MLQPYVDFTDVCCCHSRWLSLDNRCAESIFKDPLRKPLLSVSEKASTEGLGLVNTNNKHFNSETVFGFY